MGHNYIDHNYVGQKGAPLSVHAGHGSSSAAVLWPIVMAHIVMAYTVMAYVAMAYIAMAFIVMAYVAMAYIAMAYIVMTPLSVHAGHGSSSAAIHDVWNPVGHLFQLRYLYINMHTCVYTDIDTFTYTCLLLGSGLLAGLDACMGPVDPS